MSTYLSIQQNNCEVSNFSNNLWWNRYCPPSNKTCNQFRFQFIYVEHIFPTSLNKQSVMKLNPHFLFDLCQLIEPKAFSVSYQLIVWFTIIWKTWRIAHDDSSWNTKWNILISWTNMQLIFPSWAFGYDRFG